jgi:hypothetical protein
MKYTILIQGLMLCSTLQAGTIISPAGGGAPTARTTHDYYRNVTGSWDNRGGTFTERMHCRIYNYGQIGRRLPLVVMFIPWGGTLDGMESITQYEDMMNDPFLTMAIMPEYNGADDNMSSWYWGNTLTDVSTGKKTSVPWAHNAVIDIVNDVKYGKLDSILLGNTVDTNRIYAMGSSIGGTATAQIGIKHPEIFAAIHSHAGWTRYYGPTNHFFSDSRGCLSFSDLIGGIALSGACGIDSSVMIAGNADQKQLPLSTTFYRVFQYTDLNWYLGKTAATWNYRDPGFETPFIFHTTGSQDDPANQGDNLEPALDSSRRGAMYYRPDAGHSAGGIFLRWNWLRNFRKNRSFLAFTKRSNDDFQNYAGNGFMNDLTRHGWDPDSIIDEATHYHAKLTGTGTADVTLRNLQRLGHAPGTAYTVTVNGGTVPQVIADQYGCVTVPQVANAAAIDLVVAGTTTIQGPASHNSRFFQSARTTGSEEYFSLTGKKIVRHDHLRCLRGVYVVRSKTGNRATSIRLLSGK